MSDDRRFREFFGASVLVVMALWNLLVDTDLLPENGQIVHLLWTLYFFKVYPKQNVACSAAGGTRGAVDPKTFRKYVWPFVSAISDLEQIVIDFESRKNSGSLNDCLLSVDCTDIRIPNHGPRFASHKFAGKSGLRYELAIDIKTGNLVWINGPFPCGAFPDLLIFRQLLLYFLDEGERAEADDGYRGEAKIKCPSTITNSAESRAMQQRVRSRQETVNKRIKQWEILNVLYRHDLFTHGDVFRAIAVITQLSIQNGEPLFQVEYDDI